MGKDTTPNGKENSILAIVQLANKSRSNQNAIAEAGGIPLLVAALSTVGGTKDLTSISTQCSVAASAIWKLCEDNARNKVLVAEAGAITALVTMLGNPSAEMCSNAAGALSTLSHENAENQAVIARTGAIAPLCTLVREGSQETKEQSASALWALSTDNAPNKARKPRTREWQYISRGTVPYLRVSDPPMALARV